MAKLKKIDCLVVDNYTQKIELLLEKKEKIKLFISATEEEGLKVLNDAKTFFSRALVYPEKDIFYYQSDSSDGGFIRERLLTLESLIKGEEVVVVSSIQACMETMQALDDIKDKEHVIEVGKTLDLEFLVKLLIANGYEKYSRIEERGQIAIRGSIIDIYAHTANYPVRIELFDDEVDSIREFDLLSQRSINTLETTSIFLANDEDEVAGSSLLELVSKLNGLLVLDEPLKVFDKIDEIQAYNTKDEIGEFISKSDALNIISSSSTFAFSCDNEVQFNSLFETKVISSSSIDDFGGSIDKMIQKAAKWIRSGYQIQVYTPSLSRAKRMLGLIVDEGMVADINPKSPSRDIIAIFTKSISNSFIYEDKKEVFIADSDIFKKESRRRFQKYNLDNSEAIKNFSELKPKDLVVHEKYGIGIYRGIENIRMDGVGRDCLKIEYKNKSYLHILATNISSIQKYLGDATLVALSDLNSKAWSSRVSRAKKQAEVIAKELVSLYAKRLNDEGFIFSKDDELQKEMEELFEYVETEDQLKAIDEVKADMESNKIMDRLICGDVGFGKTEVAMRAAFKAVLDNKQVAVLVPTTILANQHYKVFSERMKKFPVNIALLSRFVPSSQQKKVVSMVNSGKTDIVIGTHALLRKEIKYRDLGLLIIDEEQRFGVKHKEKLKELKTRVDVITLTATPIPRSLHMSLVGIRDLSLLKEPPYDRQAIQTYILEYNDHLVEKAVSREVRRGGQIYYLHNRVESIYEEADKLRVMMPDLEIAVVHSKLPTKEIEDVFLRFNEGEIDVLVATTIVETGLDIPNVNTIIINNADCFGLSSLYQLRGRVGRGTRRAYAYLMYKKGKQLSEAQHKRLGVIREFTKLGSGTQIALKDLEIRGAGSVLGSIQSGHIEAVGYDLYCKLLKQAIRVEKGEAVVDEIETIIDLDVDLEIKPDYISSEVDKLEMYKKINMIQTQEDYLNLIDECIDRFGEPPKGVLNIIELGLIKGIANKIGISQVKEVGKFINLYFNNIEGVDKKVLLDFIMDPKNNLSVNTGVNSYLKLSIDKKSGDKIAKLRKLILEIEKMQVDVDIVKNKNSCKPIQNS